MQRAAHAVGDLVMQMDLAPTQLDVAQPLAVLPTVGVRLQATVQRLARSPTPELGGGVENRVPLGEGVSKQGAKEESSGKTSSKQQASDKQRSIKQQASDKQRSNKQQASDKQCRDQQLAEQQRGRKRQREVGPNVFNGVKEITPPYLHRSPQQRLPRPPLLTLPRQRLQRRSLTNPQRALC